MIRSEFNDFQRFLFARFPEIESWLSKVEQKAETIDAWFDALQHADLHFAKEAVRRLHAKHEPMPRGWSFLPATIREIADRLAAQEQVPEPESRYVGGEQVYRCLQCEDYGAFSVWDPTSLRQVDSTHFTKRPPTTAAVACMCLRGERWRRIMLKFDPARDLPLRRQDPDGQWRLHFQADDEEVEAAREFVKSHSRQHAKAGGE